MLAARVSALPGGAKRDVKSTRRLFAGPRILDFRGDSSISAPVLGAAVARRYYSSRDRSTGTGRKGIKMSIRFNEFSLILAKYPLASIILASRSRRTE